MKYKTRSYPELSACGLNCGLCPRYYTAGTSRCPGCAGAGFLDVHPTCGMLSCCQRKGLEYCFQCDEFPCKKYEKADEADSFITHKNQFRDMEKAKRDIETYKAELNEKIKILQELLQNYDDGRRKSFFCTAINLLELDDVKAVMECVTDTKSAVAAFNEMAEVRGVSLKLRK